MAEKSSGVVLFLRVRVTLWDFVRGGKKKRKKQRGGMSSAPSCQAWRRKSGTGCKNDSLKTVKSAQRAEKLLRGASWVARKAAPRGRRQKEY